MGGEVLDWLDDELLTSQDQTFGLSSYEFELHLPDIYDWKKCFLDNFLLFTDEPLIKKNHNK